MIDSTLSFRIGSALMFLGFLINFLIGTLGGKINLLFVSIGIVCLLLSAGLFKAVSTAKLLSIIFCAIFIGAYILLAIATFRNYFQGFGGVGLIFNAPFLIICIFSIVILFISDRK